MKVPISGNPIDPKATMLPAGEAKSKPKWGKIPMPKIQPHIPVLKSRIRKRPPQDSLQQLVRQWTLIQRLNEGPLTLKELAAACGVCERTARRDLTVLEKAGFHLKEAVEDFGRRRWQLKEPLQLPDTDRQQYRTVGKLFDALAEKLAHLNDSRLAADLQAIRDRVAKKYR